MNPNVELEIRTKKSILEDENALNGFTIVSMCNQDLDFQKKFSAKCRELGIAYFYSRSCGLYATAFCDCIEFQWSKKILRERKQSAVMDVDAMDVEQEDTEMEVRLSKNTYPSFESVCECKIQKLRKRTKFSPVLFITVQAFEQALSSGSSITKEVVDVALIDKLLTTFDCNIGMVNAWLAGYISNSVITCIQRDDKHPPFFNIYALDAFGSIISQYRMGDCEVKVLSDQSS